MPVTSTPVGRTSATSPSSRKTIRLRVGEDRRDVAGDEALLAVQPDDERHVLARPDEPAELAAVHHDERVGALELAEGGADGVGEVALVGLLDEVGDRLRVGLGRRACGRAPRARRGARGSSR